MSTYQPTAAGWVFLAVVMDLFSRKVVGWAIERDLRADTTAKTTRSRSPVGGTSLQRLKRQ